MQIGVDAQRAVETKRLFIVDDNDVTGMALQFMLADEAEAHVFDNLPAALDKALSSPPLVVILGEDLFAAQGCAALEQLKSALPDANVLLVTSDASAPQIQAGLSAGAAGTLERPLKLEQVRRKVDRQLGRRTALIIPVIPV
jgi:DNA-binding NtrC family response regulator